MVVKDPFNLIGNGIYAPTGTTPIRKETPHSIELENIKSITITPEGLCLTPRLLDMPSLTLSSEEMCVVLFEELRRTQDHVELLSNQLNKYDS